MCSGRKVCKKWWDGFWMQKTTQIPNKTYLQLFGPFTMLFELCMQIHSVVFALSRQIIKQKYAKIIYLLCAGNKVFVKYQAQGGVGLSPKPPCVRPCCFHSGSCSKRVSVFPCYSSVFQWKVPHKTSLSAFHTFVFASWDSELSRYFE